MQAEDCIEYGVNLPVYFFFFNQVSFSTIYLLLLLHTIMLLYSMLYYILKWAISSATLLNNSSIYSHASARKYDRSFIPFLLSCTFKVFLLHIWYSNWSYCSVFTVYIADTWSFSDHLVLYYFIRDSLFIFPCIETR